MPSPVSEIAAMENVAATVLRKSLCLTKFEGALSLLLSAAGSGPLSQRFRGIQRWRQRRFAWCGKRSGLKEMGERIDYVLEQLSKSSNEW